MFDYFVSLGMSCPTASSMSKYGLRSFSGPFDWLIASDFSWVMYYIETDFVDFLQQAHLEIYDNEWPNRFIDNNCGFIFLHDKEDYKTDYDSLRAKYDRRIKNFIKASYSKTCFLRSVVRQEELEYIKENAHYIQSTIKRNNSENEIVFLLKSNLLIPDGTPFKFHHMPGVYSGASRQLLRSWFDGADDFLDFCAQNYSSISMMKNIAVDHKREKPNITWLLNQRLPARRYRTLTAIWEHDFSKDALPEQTIIYGAGYIGKELFQKIKDYTQVEFFIDKDKGGTEFQGVPIISLNEVESLGDAKIIVSAAYDFKNIKTGLYEKFGEVAIISIDDILKLKF